MGKDLEEKNHPILLRTKCDKEDCESSNCPTLCSQSPYITEKAGNLTHTPNWSKVGYSIIPYPDNGGGAIMIYPPNEVKDLTKEELQGRIPEDPVNTSVVQKYSSDVHEVVRP